MQAIAMKFTVGGVLLFCAAAPTFAGSPYQAGQTVGAAVGAPAPPGLYFANTASWGCRNTKPNEFCEGVSIPILFWSTPWTILGARPEFTLAPTNLVYIDIENTTHSFGLANPFFSGQLAWDLGGGWGISYLLGVYLDVDTAFAFSSDSLNQRVAVSYTANGWNLTTNFVLTTHFDEVTGSPQASPCPVSPVFPSNGCNPHSINVDLTATKRFGKWELGPIAYGSADLSSPVPGYLKQSQFAMGGLVGYWFDQLIVQGFVSTDVYEEHYRGKEVRGWTRIIIPLGNQPAVPVAN